MQKHNKAIAEQVKFLRCQGLPWREIANKLKTTVSRLQSLVYRNKEYYKECCPVTVVQRKFVINQRSLDIPYPMIQLLWIKEFGSDAPGIKAMQNIVRNHKYRMKMKYGQSQ